MPTGSAAYGYARETSPTIDALAAESIVFSNAVAQYTVTKTSHRSLFTSRRRYADEDATWAEILRERGYRTAAYTGGGFMNRRFGHARGFDLYFDAVRYNGLEDLTPRVLDWLRTEVGRALLPVSSHLRRPLPLRPPGALLQHLHR